MKKFIIALIASVSISAPALALTPPTAGSNTTTAAAAQPAKAGFPNKTAGNDRAATPAAKKPPDKEKLTIAPQQKKSVKAAINQAIKAFVPSQKIDASKAVDFPTNI